MILASSWRREVAGEKIQAKIVPVGNAGVRDLDPVHRAIDPRGKVGEGPECQAPVACGGSSRGTCAEGEFCKHADGACAADAEGTCTALPLACQPIVLEVCGCDGTTYPSACFADGAAVNVNHTGACTTTR